MTSDHNLDVALQLAAAGLAVFPTDQRKRPAIPDWDANSTTDATIIRRWWRIRPGALAAIDLRKSDLFVVDADRHGGPDGVAAWHDLVWDHGDDLSANPMARTPSGGLHVYFTQPSGDLLGNREGGLPTGINVRGAGGYVIAPYCIRADGTFYEMTEGDLIEALKEKAIPAGPKWLISIIRYRPAPTATMPPRLARGATGRFAAYAKAAFDKIMIEVANEPPGGRNIKLNASAYRLGRMAARGWLTRREVEAELRNAAEANGLLAEDGERSVNATISSGLTAGLTKPAADPEARK